MALLRLAPNGNQLMLGTGGQAKPVQFFRPGWVILLIDTSESMDVFPREVNPPLPNMPMDTRNIEHGSEYLVVPRSECHKYRSALDIAKVKAVEFANKARAQRYLTGVVSFNSDAYSVREPDSSVEISESVKSLHAGGTTDMAKAIRLAHGTLDKTNGAKAMVIVSDGAPDNQTQALQEAQEAKDDGIRIITIGVPGADQAFLRQIASSSELAELADFQTLGLALDSAMKMLPPASKPMLRS